MLAVKSENLPPLSAPSEIELSIVMPCLNEAETLETCIRKAITFLERNKVKGEVVVADNGSTDGSQEIASRCGARLVPVAARGYGAALFGGITAAYGRYIIMGDADDSYDLLNLTPFLEELRAGNDLVMGNRFRGGIHEGAMPWKNRWIGNPILTGIGRLFFKCPAKDFHCGLRGFSRHAFDQMELRTTGMEFASEMVIKATLRGMRITEVPTTLSKDGRSRPPHLKPWRDGWRHLRFMLLYSPRWLFLYPGLLLTVLGLLIGARICIAPLVIAGVHFDVQTLLYAAASVLIGSQGIAFAVFSKVFGIAEGLLPPDPAFARLQRCFSLEGGLIIGALLIFCGLIGSVAAVAWWSAQGFGPLNARETLRAVIPSFLSIALGVQVMLSSFFLSVLSLKLRR